MKTIDDLLTLEEVKKELERQEKDVQRKKFFSFLLKNIKTKHEAELWLKNKKIEPERAELMLYDAEQAGLINDNFYAKEFILGHDTWGKRRIIFELSRRGVSADNISAAFDELEDDEFERDNISERKKIISFLKYFIDGSFDVRDRKNLNKIKARLYRRGFADRDIRAALEEFI